MIDMIIPEKLSDPHINDDVDHLAAAMRYAIATQLRQALRYGARIVVKGAQQPAQYSYACECKHCEITLYTSTKRLNCEFCGSSDPEVFTCTKLE